MTLDEAIKHCESVARENEHNAEYYKSRTHYNSELQVRICKECAKDHRQYAKWLQELKAYRDMWDKVIRELHELIQGDSGVEQTQVGEKRALGIIERYKKEIEK